MNKQILTTIIVALVVAVVASLITANITGNVINVAKGTAGKVYTTSEIDAKLKNVATNQGVLDILSKCGVYIPGTDYKNVGDRYCQERGKQCALSMIHIDTTDTSRDVLSPGCKITLAEMLKTQGFYKNSTSSNYIGAEVSYLCCNA